MLKQLILAFATLVLFASYVGAQSISCQPLTTSELELKLESFGGYNKRYQAITRKDAENFPILLNQPAAVKLPVYKLPSIIKKLFRGKRQANSFPQTNFTSVAKRGSLDQNGYHRLCTEWSAVTTLSPDYFPRYLNEVICDKKDNGCLGHEGACIQGSFVVNVLKNTGVCGADGKETWQLVSQSFRSCCSCRLYQGSSLSGLL